MHGLFLTCTEKFYIYIYQTHNQLFGRKRYKPLFKEKRKTPHLLGKPTFCWWWQIPIQSGPLPGINCLPLTFQSPLTPTHPLGPYYITKTTSTTSVFLSGTKTMSLWSLLHEVFSTLRHMIRGKLASLWAIVVIFKRCCSPLRNFSEGCHFPQTLSNLSQGWQHLPKPSNKFSGGLPMTSETFSIGFPQSAYQGATFLQYPWDNLNVK
jgi:hypothetical protein